MKTYLLKEGVRQAIAKAGETDIVVAYNAKTWIDEYPAGNPQLMVTTPGGKRVPVTVEAVDNLITGQVPNELLAGPGVYSYVFVWTSGSTQLESGRCECLVLGSSLTKDLTHDSRRTPEWAERIFLAAEVIEGAVNGAMEARNTAANMAAEAAESEANAAGSAEEAGDSATLADQKATAAAASAEDAAASAAALHPENYVAQAFSASSAYSAGTYVMHDGYLYRLTADHEADVAWEDTAKVQVKVADDVRDLNGAIESFDLDYYDAEFANETIDADNVVTDSSIRLLSKEFTVQLGEKFAINEGYRFRFAHVQNSNSVVFSPWLTGEQAITADMMRYGDQKRIHVSNTSSSADITPSEVTYTTDIKSLLTYNKPATKTDIQIVRHEIDEVKKEIPDQYSLNRYYTTKTNMMWAAWYYPMAMSFKRVRNKLYWGFCTNDGCTGIASYDYDTHDVVKNVLKQTNEVDDHNSPALYVFDDGRIIVAYSGGHNTDKKIHVRISSTNESVERFGPDNPLDSAGTTTYSQFIYYNNVLYLFYRVNNISWAVRSSADKGETWTDEKILLVSTMQYYCKFAPTLTDGVLRMVMYSNPTATDPNIRMGFLHLDNGNIYNADDSELLGTQEISYTLFDVILPVESGKTQRLHDVAITAINRPLFLFCPFTTASNQDGVYKIYDAGTIVDVCNAGLALWNPKYQCGCTWINPGKILAIRADTAIGGYDVVEIYNYVNGEVSLDKELARKARGNIRLRYARPIVDVNGKSALWFSGYYNINNFKDFNGDAVIYDLTTE